MVYLTVPLINYIDANANEHFTVLGLFWKKTHQKGRNIGKTMSFPSI